MNKTKIILSAVGGTLALLVLVMAYLAWSASVAKTVALEGDEEEGTDGFETILEKAESLSRKSIYPCAASVKALDSNTEVVVTWQDEAFRLAAQGDRPVLSTTPAAFKEFIVGDARRVAALPAAVGTLVADGFDFGPFKPYISEGKMPAEAELAGLQRRWDDVSTIAELLSTSGVVRLTGVAIKEKAAEEKKEEARPARNAKKGGKKGGAAPKPTFNPSTVTYVMTFQTRPAAFVACINNLERCPRFMVVDDFTFQREQDVLVAALGGGEKKREAEPAGGRRRGRRGARAAEPVTEAAEKEAQKNGLVTDPLTDPPLTVTMTITVYDFGSLEEAKEEAK